MRAVVFRGAVALLAGALLAACDDPFDSYYPPVIASDTVALAVPSDSSSLPSALDLTAPSGNLGGGRYPERLADATLGWDFALRRHNGGLALLAGGCWRLGTH